MDVKGFCDWAPSAAPAATYDYTMGNAEALAQVVDVVFANRDEWPLSIRSWLYRLVTQKGWEKSWEGAKSNQGLKLIMNRGRRSRAIPMEAVSATRGEKLNISYYRDAKQLAYTVAHVMEGAIVDPQGSQPRRLVLWTETAGYIDRFEELGREYGIDVFAGQGFDTLTGKYEFSEYCRDNGPIIVLHFGDLDADGECLYEALESDVTAFLDDDDWMVEFQRVGLYDHHIDTYELTWTPQDLGKCKRAGRRPIPHGRDAQGEALTPAEVIDVMRDAIDEHWDAEAAEEDAAASVEMREEALALVKQHLGIA